MSPKTYLGLLRRRASLFGGLRAVLFGAGATILLFALGASAAGPVAGWAEFALVGALVLLAQGLGAYFLWWRPSQALRGPKAARLLESREPELAGPVQSAAELQERPNGSETLVAAHRRAVEARLFALPPRQVVQSRGLHRDRWVLGGIASIAVGACILSLSDRASAGSYALLHPGAEVDGHRVARVIESVEARLVFPDYVEKPDQVVHDVTRLSVPRGTTVHLQVKARLAATAAELVVGQSSTALRQSTPDGILSGEFTVTEDATLQLRVQGVDEAWLVDPVARSVVALIDAPPAVSMEIRKVARGTEEPVQAGAEEDGHWHSTLTPDDEVEVGWFASDDVKVTGVALVVETAGGRTRRLRLTQTRGGGGGREEMNAHRFRVGEFIEQPGDSLTMHVEAVDNDSAFGPNVGTSGAVTLSIATQASLREQVLAGLDRALDLGVSALADRLEWDAESSDDIAARQQSTEAFSSALRELSNQRQNGSTTVSGSRGLFLEMARRLSRLGETEARLYRSQPAAGERLVNANDKLIVQLESDVLSIANRIEQTQIEDAAELARELDALRRELTSLLAELRRADNPEARERLMQAIARAHQRLTELSQRLAQMNESVPGEHQNLSAGDMESTQGALEAMREAVERGDLDAAEAELARLRAEVDRLAGALNSNSEEMMNARFGPGQQAMAEALDQLAGLEAEQHQLHRRTSDARQAAADRAIRASGALDQHRTDQLAREAEELMQELRELSADGSAIDREILESARARTKDTLDALRAGDLGEARSMSSQASAEVDALSRDLDLSALMFPGQRGETRGRARNAEALARGMQRLSESIDRTIPNLGDFIDQAEGRQLQRDADRQSEVRSSAERLTELFASTPAGEPLSPEGEAAMGEIIRQMAEAQARLREQDPIDASEAQREAAAALTELREQLEQDQQGGSGGGGGEQGSTGEDFREEVLIPDANDFEGPNEQRRRLLDSMRQQTPGGYEAAVRRYYEGLLR